MRAGRAWLERFRHFRRKPSRNRKRAKQSSLGKLKAGSAQGSDRRPDLLGFRFGRVSDTLRSVRESEWSKILGWPGYRVYQFEINELAKTLRLWVRRKRGNLKLVCSGCGRRVHKIHEIYEREVRDLPCFEFRTTVVIELYRVLCPDCGIKTERVGSLPSNAPFSKRFEEEVGGACEGASARQTARRFGLSGGAVRAIDLRCLERWKAGRRMPALKQMGVDEIFGVKAKFITVVSNLETGEPIWFGRERKKETLDGFFQTQLSARQRREHPGGMPGHVEAVSREHRAVGPAMPHRVRQVPCPAARQCGRR